MRIVVNATDGVSSRSKRLGVVDQLLSGNWTWTVDTREHQDQTGVDRNAVSDMRPSMAGVRRERGWLRVWLVRAKNCGCECFFDEKRPPSETHTHETHETRHGKVTQSVIFEVSSEDEFSRMSTASPVASRKVGSGPAAAAAIFFRKIFFRKKFSGFVSHAS